MISRHSYRASRVLTKESFEYFLSCLDTDQEHAAQRYLDLRDRLIYLFCRCLFVQNSEAATTVPVACFFIAFYLRSRRPSMRSAAVQIKPSFLRTVAIAFTF
jgi:hypothetical protein